jgi:PilZ domain-containing protein
MSAATMPHLVEGQPARLDVGESIACRVIGFSGPEVVLALETQPEEEIERGAKAYLLLESDGKLQAVRGRVTAASQGEVALRLTDDIRLGQRRIFSRAPIPLPVRVRTPDGVQDWSSVTRDVSAGGVCVAREGDPGDGTLELAIDVAGHEVRAEVRVVRVTDSDLGVEFEQIEDRDRLLLASLALAYHRPR